MPVDRHVERVSRRVGLIRPKATADDAHEIFLALLEPDQMYEAHVEPDHPRPADLPRASDPSATAARSGPLPVRRPEGAVSRAPAVRTAYTRVMLSHDPAGAHGTISPRILLVDDDPNLLVVLSERLTRRRLRRGDRPRRPGGAPPARDRLAGPADHRHDDAPPRRPVPGPRDQEPGRPADHRPVGDRRRRQQGRHPRRDRRGLRHQAVPLPGAAGPDQPRPPPARRPRPAPEPRPRPAPRPRAAPPPGDRRRRSRSSSRRPSRGCSTRSSPTSARSSRPRRCSPGAGRRPRTPTRPTSGSRCAGCARSSSWTRTGRPTC